MLSESTDMITRFISQYSFFDNSVIESGMLRIFSIDSGIIERGDFAIFEFINDKISKYRPSRVVIDPITILEYIVKTFEERKLEYPEKRGFALSLFSEFESWDTLLLMTGELSGEQLADNPWTYMVDSVIKLDKLPGAKVDQRYLEVIKMRGSGYFEGRHSYEITGDGITVYPRFEPLITVPEIQPGSISTGIKALDKMIGGGLPRVSATMIAGSAGCGKNVLGLHFIANGILNKQPCLVVSFEDEHEEFINTAMAFGLDMKKYEEMDILRFIYRPYGHINQDELALKIQEVINEIKVERVLIDSISGLRHAMPDPEELRIYLMSLVKYFKRHNITSQFTYELPDMVGAVKIPDQGLPFVMDSIFVLRNIEIEAGIRKSIMIMKMQGREFDNEIREFNISGKGIDTLGSFSEYSGLMSDTPVISARFKEALQEGTKLFK